MDGTLERYSQVIRFGFLTKIRCVLIISFHEIFFFDYVGGGRP